MSFVAEDALSRSKPMIAGGLFHIHIFLMCACMQMPDGGINESNEVIMFVSTPTKEQSMMDSG